MTPTRRFYDSYLGGSLDAFVSERRQTGLSWQAIARDLTTATGTPVSDETVRRWYKP